LKVADIHAFSDVAELESKIAANESVRRDLAAAYAAPAETDKKKPFYVTQPGIQLVKALGTLLAGATYWAPYVKNLMGELPSLIVKNDELARTIVFISREDYDQAVSLLDTRIAAYRRRLDEVKAHAPSGNWIFKETPAECWAAWRAGERPARIRGALGRPVPSSARLVVDDSEIATESSSTLAGARLRRPSLVIDATFADSPDEKVRLRAAPLDLPRRTYEASLAGKPLVVDALVRLDYLSDGPRAKALHDALFSKPEEQAAEEAPAKLTIRPEGFELSIDGVAISWEK
jgi:hypothetical protein